jgi:N-acyl-L-homoserine lactone synthetase
MSTEVRRSRSSDDARPEQRVNDRFAQLLTKIDYRRADSPEQREEIFRLRYEAYRRDGGIPPNATRTFSDSYDDAANAYLFGLYIDGELATAIRLHIASNKHCPDFPSLKVFPDFLQPELDSGKVLLDTTRFSSDEKLSQHYRGLPYATVRLCVLAAEHFGADHVLAAVRADHQEWYRRSFDHQVVCEPRPYPHLSRPIGLMTVHFPTIKYEWYRRYPFFDSSVFERRKLFERRLHAASSGNGPEPTGTCEPSLKIGTAR